jgi:hypothetical protein
MIIVRIARMKIILNKIKNVFIENVIKNDLLESQNKKTNYKFVPAE